MWENCAAIVGLFARFFFLVREVIGAGQFIFTITLPLGIFYKSTVIASSHAKTAELGFGTPWLLKNR